MSEISETFRRLKAEKKGALIAYLTVGDPDPKATPRLVGALVEGGADLVELGVPFSDPIADGPTIQNAVSRSLSKGTKPETALEVARAVRRKYDTPLVLMTYYNPIYRRGLDGFLGLARESGISGVIVPDLPVEESSELKQTCERHSIDTIFLASPSTDESRLKMIVAQTSGYLYLISLYGVTGIRASVSDTVLDTIKTRRKFLDGTLPLAAGFGISRPEHVKQILAAGADGVIVGSAFVKVIEENRRNIKKASLRLKKLAATLKKACEKPSAIAT